MRRRSRLLDAALTAAVLVVGIAAVLAPAPQPSDGRLTVELVSASLAGFAVLGRRRFPLPLLALATVDADVGSSLPAAMPLATYAWIRYGPSGRVPRWAPLVVSALLVLRPWGFSDANEVLNHVIVVVLVVVLPAVLALWVRTRAELIVALQERAERAEQEQQARAREAVLEERARITREMHDVVGHRVSLMVLQAGAVDMAADDADRVRVLAGQLQDAGRRSLEELRQLLGLLQEDPDEAPLAPQPSLDDVAELVDDAVRAGLDVTLTRSGPARELDPTVGRTAYRVVQEALTNAGKHAPGGPVFVTLALGDGELTVTVVNRRATRPPAALPSGGLGLIGLRERVRTVGGTLRAEPRLDGGFGVEAVLPA